MEALLAKVREEKVDPYQVSVAASELAKQHPQSHPQFLDLFRHAQVLRNKRWLFKLMNDHQAARPGASHHAGAGGPGAAAAGRRGRFSANDSGPSRVPGAIVQGPERSRRRSALAGGESLCQHTGRDRAAAAGGREAGHRPRSADPPGVLGEHRAVPRDPARLAAAVRPSVAGTAGDDVPECRPRLPCGCSCSSRGQLGDAYQPVLASLCARLADADPTVAGAAGCRRCCSCGTRMWNKPCGGP